MEMGDELDLVVFFHVLLFNKVMELILYIVNKIMSSKPFIIRSKVVEPMLPTDSELYD